MPSRHSPCLRTRRRGRTAVGQMGLRDKYHEAMQAAKGHMEVAAEERDGKLYFKGTTRTQAEAN